MNRRAVLGLAAIAGTGFAASKGVCGTLASSRPTRNLAPGPDIGGQLNRLIRELSESGGGTVALEDGVYGTRMTIRLLSNVMITGRDETVIKAMAPIGDKRTGDPPATATRHRCQPLFCCAP